MAHIPIQVLNIELQTQLEQHGYLLVNRGKVRDTFSIPGQDDKLLVVATDRVSIFDFVLPAVVSGKGEILVAMTVFWLKNFFRNYPNHLIAYGKAVADYLPAALADDKCLLRRAIVVTKLEMLPVECIVRGYLTGTGLLAYKNSGQICVTVTFLVLFNRFFGKI